MADRIALAKNAQAAAAAKTLDDKLAAIEAKIYQVQNRSEQDPLNYPIMLNDKLAALGRTVESSLGAPTDQAYAVHADLKRRLNAELTALDAALSSDLPALNRLLASSGLKPVERRPEPSVEPGTADIKGQGAEGEEEEERD